MFLWWWKMRSHTTSDSITVQYINYARNRNSKILVIRTGIDVLTCNIWRDRLTISKIYQPKRVMVGSHIDSGHWGVWVRLYWHRYLEEEAVITYSHALDELDAGNIPEWTNMAAPDIAKVYWRLKVETAILTSPKCWSGAVFDSQL